MEPRQNDVIVINTNDKGAVLQGNYFSFQAISFTLERKRFYKFCSYLMFMHC